MAFYTILSYKKLGHIEMKLYHTFATQFHVISSGILHIFKESQTPVR
jgi:hypothetical protein